MQPGEKYLGENEILADLYTDRLFDVPSGCEVEVDVAELCSFE